MKPLQQLFHILKMQILIYPYRFIGILLFYCWIFVTLANIDTTYTRSWVSSTWIAVPCMTLWMLSFIFLRQGECYEDQRSASVAWPQTVALENFLTPMLSSSFFWTRALDRNLIQLSDIMLYAVFVIILLLPGITLIGQSMEPLQIIFQSPEDNGAFQRALLADPHLGAYQFYDNAERIIVAIPHGWDYQIGLMLFQTLFLSLFLLWISKGLNDPKRWRYLSWMIVVIMVSGILPFAMLLYAQWKNIFIDNRFFPDDTSFYGDRFMLYANYHLCLWIGLALAAIFLIQSIIRKHLRPA